MTAITEDIANTHRVRSVAAIALVVLTVISISAASVAYWVHNVALDTDEWMGIVEPVITSEEFTAALSGRISDEVIEALNVETRLEVQLSALDRFIGEQLVEAINPDPAVVAIIRGLDVPRFADLADPISAGTQQRIFEATEALVGSNAFQTSLLAVVRSAHQATVLLVTSDVEDFETVYIEDGQVKWNAVLLMAKTIEHVIEERILEGADLTLPDLSDNPIASEAIARLGTALDVEISDDFGQITLMSEDDFLAIQRAGRLLEQTFWALVVASMALIAATVWISPDRRRTTVQLALGTVVGLVLSALTIRAATEAFQDSLSDPSGQAAAGAVISHVIASLRRVWLLVAIMAGIVGLAAYLAGRPGGLKQVAARINQTEDQAPDDLDRFVARHFDLVAVAVIGLGLLLLWLTGLSLFWLLLVLVLVGGFVWFGQSARQRVAGSTDPDEEPAESHTV